MSLETSVRTKYLLKKNQGLGLSKALAREYLRQVGITSLAHFDPNDKRMEPLRIALKKSLSGKTHAGLPARLIKKLAGAQ